MLLFFANYNYNPILKVLYLKESIVVSVIKTIKRFLKLHEQFKNDTKFINLNMKKYYNKKHKDILL